MIDMKKSGDWQWAFQVTDDLARDAGVAARKAVADEAVMFLRQVRMAFRLQGAGSPWPPLADLTLALRRNAGKAEGSFQSIMPLGTSFPGTKSLIRTGYLRQSVQLFQAGKSAWFVGVHRTASKAAFNVASIHEQGPAVIPITDRMRRFFMRLFLIGVIRSPWPARGKTFIVIPRRAFLEPTYERWKQGSHDRVRRRWVYYLLNPASRRKVIDRSKAATSKISESATAAGEKELIG